MSNRDREHNPDKGKNFGQGLAGISDKDRRALAAGAARNDPARDDFVRERAGDSRPEGDDGAQSSSSDQRR